jgi:hypothetical protein
MPMPVMGITHVRMGMLQRPMPMLMGMPEGLISTNTFKLLGCMDVLVMGIAALRIVPMAMGMTQNVVVMPVAVLLPQQQQHTGGHQASGHEQLGCEGFAQDYQGEQGAHKWRRGEQHRFASRSEIAQGQQIQPDRDPIAQGTDAQ